MPSIYLGPLLLKWCKNCNLPILEKNRCDICKNKTIKVNHIGELYGIESV